MLSKEDNELLTQVSPETPMGQLFRRFWLPAMLSSELPDPDGTPVRLKLLGEELITFRDTSGRVGCLDAYCPHRGAAMFFGRNEEDGLRCIYHGWKFDVEGNCTHMPNCVEGESFRQRLKTTAYPAIEGGGLIWFYMGPPEKQPPPPGFEWFVNPASWTHAAKYIYHSNYMQALEGDFDPSHASFLHATLDNNMSNPVRQLRGEDDRQTQGLRLGTAPGWQPPEVEAVDFECGVGTRNIGSTPRVRNPNTGSNTGRGPSWLMPCFDPVGISSQGTLPINIKVPADDEHTIYFRVRWSPTGPLTEKQAGELRVGGYINPEVDPGTFLYKNNIFNDYGMDRIKQKHFSFSGLSQTAVQDTAMQENQWGPVSKRWKEHLVSTDKIIIRVRQRMLTTAKELMEGKEPAEPWNPQGYRTTDEQRPVSEPIATTQSR
jgi:nitrite reductase/ring-hydroxylating ferredoxin subunit